MEENIKKCWSGTNFRTEGDSGRAPRRVTALQALAKRYDRFSRFSLIFALIAPNIINSILKESYIDNRWSMYGLLFYIFAYFITSFFMDRWLAKGISAIDVAEMPVAEVCRLAYFYRRRHFQFMAILIPMALLLIVWMGWLLSDDVYVIYGMASGFIVGAILAYGAFRKFMKEYREVTAD